MKNRTDDKNSSLYEDICVHIFSASATLVGVCLTVIGIIRILISGKGTHTVADDLLVVDALIFLASCLLSYWALRARSMQRMYKVERIADFTFIIGLLLMVATCGFIAYTLVD